MIYYLVLFAYMVLVQYEARHIKGKEEMRMFLTFLPLFLFGAIRVGCGDYEIYENYNNWVRTSYGQIYDVIERMEPGYAYLNLLLPYRWIIVLSSLLSCYAFACLFIKLVPQQYRWFSIFLFFIVGDKTFYFMFSSIRNSIAISILLIYLSYRIDSKDKSRPLIKEIALFLIVTFFAYLFHASALMFFPIAFVATINKKISSTEIFIWLAALVLLWIIPIDQLVDDNWVMGTEYFSRYEDYVEETSNAGFLAKLGATIFALLCLMNTHLYYREGRFATFSRLMLLFVYSFMLGSLNMRVSYYFVAFAIIYLTYVYANRKFKWSMPLIAFAIVFLLYSSFIAGALAIGPHSSFVSYKIALFQ